jgi:anti-sigma factor RsiW
MHCSDFLELYSDYRDGTLADRDRLREMQQHLFTCRRCMQYHARVARGVTVLRTFTDLEPSPRFRRDLTTRLARTPAVAEEPVTPAPAGLMVALMVATAFALLLWEGKGDAVREASTVAAPTPPSLPAVVANAGVPFVSFADLTVPSFAAEWHTPGAADQTFLTRATVGP